MCVHMHTYGLLCHGTHADIGGSVVLPFYHSSPGNQTKVATLGRKNLYQLKNLNSPMGGILY